MSQVVVDGISLAVTREQLKQFDQEAARRGTTREAVAAQSLVGELEAERIRLATAKKVRRNASDTQAMSESIDRLRELAKSNGHDWKSDPAFTATARASAVAELEDLENLFDVTGNGRCVWRALQVAYDNRLTSPPWVWKYLYDSAVAMDDISPGKQAALKVAKVLKLHTSGGRAAAVARFRDQRIRFYTASYMASLREREGLDCDHAAQRAAEDASHYLPKPVSASTVKRWYRTFKAAIGQHTAEMQKYQEEVLREWPVRQHPYRIERLPARQRKPIK